MTIETLLAQAATTASLVSWWKMLLMLPPFFGWAWLVATKLDKDARYFHLNGDMWNGIHLAAGVGALAAMLFIPIFWISWPVGVLILLGPILAYWHIRNNAVPETQKFYLTSESFSTKMTARAQKRATKQALIQFSDSKGQDRNVPLKDDPLFPVHMQAEDLIGPALSARASRVEMLIGPNGGTVRQTIDGIQYKRETIPADAAVRLMDYLKDIGGLDVQDRRRRQAGKMEIGGASGETKIDIITAGSSAGQTVILDFDRENRLHKPFDGLGLLAPQLEALRAFEQPHERHGLILIGAPRGHGLTTTSYSFISRHDAYTSNVKTLEREVMVPLMGVDQVQWDPTNPDVDYATNLQSILRRDPDIVLTAELTDNESAKVAADPGMKGPLIYIQQSVPTIADQIREWVKKVGDLKQSTRALRAVTNQRLMRSLCPNCRQAYQPTPEQIKKLNLPPNKVKQLYRASGKVQVKNKIEDCPVCGGTGYLGQTAAFEVLIVTDEVRKHLAAGDLKAALAQARRNNMFYIQEAALSKVISGETDLDEVVRVTSAPKASPSGSGGGGASPKVSDGSGAPPPTAPRPTPVG